MAASLVLNRRRQVPAEDSAGFGAIAERFRRAGELERAVALCQEGLRKYPRHLSSRVTLGWALLDLGRYEEARVELEQVLKRAPDNLAAIRGLAQLHDRTEHDDVADMGDSRWAPPQESLRGEDLGDDLPERTNDLVASLLGSTGAPVMAAAPAAPAPAMPAAPAMSAAPTTMSAATAMPAAVAMNSGPAASAAPALVAAPVMAVAPAAPIVPVATPASSVPFLDAPLAATPAPRVYNEPFAGTIHESFTAPVIEAFDEPFAGHFDEEMPVPAAAGGFDAFDPPLAPAAALAHEFLIADAPIVFHEALPAEPAVLAFDEPLELDPPISLGEPEAVIAMPALAHESALAEVAEHDESIRPFSADLLSHAPFAFEGEPSVQDFSWDEPEPYIDAEPDVMPGLRDDAPRFSRVEADTPVPDEGRLGPWPPVFEEDLPRPAPAPLRLAAAQEPSAEWPPAERLPPPPPDSHFSTVVAKPVQKGLVGALSRFSRRVDSRRRSLLSEYKAG